MSPRLSHMGITRKQTNEDIITPLPSVGLFIPKAGFPVPKTGLPVNPSPHTRHMSDPDVLFANAPHTPIEGSAQISIEPKAKGLGLEPQSETAVPATLDEETKTSVDKLENLSSEKQKQPVIDSAHPSPAEAATPCCQYCAGCKQRLHSQSASTDVSKSSPPTPISSPLPSPKIVTSPRLGFRFSRQFFFGALQRGGDKQKNESAKLGKSEPKKDGKTAKASKKEAEAKQREEKEKIAAKRTTKKIVYEEVDPKDIWADE